MVTIGMNYDVLPGKDEVFTNAVAGVRQPAHIPRQEDTEVGAYDIRVHTAPTHERRSVTRPIHSGRKPSRCQHDAVQLRLPAGKRPDLHAIPHAWGNPRVEHEALSSGRDAVAA